MAQVENGEQRRSCLYEPMAGVVPTDAAADVVPLQYVNVFFALNRSFYLLTSSMTSVLYVLHGCL